MWWAASLTAPTTCTSSSPATRRAGLPHVASVDGEPAPPADRRQLTPHRRVVLLDRRQFPHRRLLPDLGETGGRAGRRGEYLVAPGGVAADDAAGVAAGEVEADALQAAGWTGPP